MKPNQWPLLKAIRDLIDEGWSIMTEPRKDFLPFLMMWAAMALIAVILLGWAKDALSAEPGEPSCPGRRVVALIDATTAYDETDRAAIQPAFAAMMNRLAPGDQLVIATVAESAMASRILFDRCAPGGEAVMSGEQDWLELASGLVATIFSTPSDPAIEWRAFLDDARTQVLPVLNARHDTPATALFATVARYAPWDELGLYSDLLESADHSPRSVLGLDLRVATELRGVQGSKVYIAGVGRFHDRTRRPLSSAERSMLLANWRGWFGDHGAILVEAR